MWERGHRRLGREAALLGVLGFLFANCSGKTTAEDDEDDGGSSGTSGAGAGRGGSGKGGATSGGATSGGATSGGAMSVGGAGGSSAEAGAPNGSGGTDPSDGGEPNGAGGSGGRDVTGGSGGSDTGGSGGASGGKGGAAGNASGGKGGTAGDASGGKGGAAGGSSGGKGGGAGSGGAGGSGGMGPPAECGNGITEGDEECDDLNTEDDDGCSGDCAVESGNVCTQATCSNGLCTYDVAAVFRDFNAHAQPNGHPDFDPGFNSAGAIQGLVTATLDGEGKPVLVGPNVNAFMHGVSQFGQWYRDVPGTNAAISSSIKLHGYPGATFANRYGKDGEQWSGAPTYANVLYGGPGTNGGEPGCTLAACDGRPCYDPCTPWGYDYACCGDDVTAHYDGTPLFFPLDGAPGILTETRYAAKVAQEYGWPGWPWEADVATTLGVVTPVQTAFSPFPSATHNFSFTSELHFRVRYDAANTQAIEITGDDDIWLFLNGHLAIDLGGWHTPLSGYVSTLSGVVTMTAVVDDALPPTSVTKTATASSFGLVDGEVYTVSIFHAERQKEGSTLQLRVSGYELDRSVCAPP